MYDCEIHNNNSIKEGMEEFGYILVGDYANDEVAYYNLKVD